MDKRIEDLYRVLLLHDLALLPIGHQLKFVKAFGEVKDIPLTRLNTALALTKSSVEIYQKSRLAPETTPTCDHDWRSVRNSFDKIFYNRYECIKCGVIPV